MNMQDMIYLINSLPEGKELINSGLIRHKGGLVPYYCKVYQSDNDTLTMHKYVSNEFEIVTTTSDSKDYLEFISELVFIANLSNNSWRQGELT